MASRSSGTGQELVSLSQVAVLAPPLFIGVRPRPSSISASSRKSMSSLRFRADRYSPQDGSLNAAQISSEGRLGFSRTSSRFWREGSSCPRSSRPVLRGCSSPGGIEPTEWRRRSTRF